MNTSYQLLAAKYLRRQAKQLAEQLDGLRAAEDIEFVHRARVATRRLRAGLKMFDGCFPTRLLRRWRKAIRRTTSKLGSARDCDVQIDFLCGLLSALNTPSCFPGIAGILIRLERRRERLQRKVVKAVDRLEQDGTLRQMRRHSRRILRGSPAEAITISSPEVLAQTEQHIRRQLDRLLQYQDSLSDPEDRQRHHAMRIAAKRLRYTLEISKPLYPSRLDVFVEAVKNIKSLLGDVHDCDVWIEHLDDFTARQRKRAIRLFGHAGRLARLRPGIEYLREDRRRWRQTVFGELVDFWADLEKRRFWDELIAAVSIPGKNVLHNATAEPDAPKSPLPEAAADALPSPPADERPSSNKSLLTAGS